MVKCLPHNHEDLRSDTRTLVKNKQINKKINLVPVHIVILEMKKWTQRNPGAQWLASLAELVKSRFSERLRLVLSTHIAAHSNL